MIGSWKPAVGYNTWFLNEKDNLLVGWADDGADNRWRDHHKSLLPEDYVSDIERKMVGDGLDVDDYAHIATLSPRSLDEWVYPCYNALWVRQVLNVSDDPVLWQLYDSLDSADKQAAQSEAGLPLAKLQSGHDAKHSVAEAVAELVHEGTYRGNWLKYKQDMSAAMNDPKVISSMVMRLDKAPVKSHSYYAASGTGYIGNNEPPPPALGLYRYFILVNCRIDGNDREFDAGGISELPIRSPAREAEILAAAAAKAKGSQ